MAELTHNVMPSSLPTFESTYVAITVLLLLKIVRTKLYIAERIRFRGGRSVGQGVYVKTWLLMQETASRKKPAA